jgi:altronate dehydratase small subunit
MPKKALVANERDNVATAIADLSAGDAVTFVRGDQELTITVADEIPCYHKFALSPIAGGATVVKYGESIGEASADIAQGEHVHVHNVESRRGRGDKGVPNEAAASTGGAR